MRQHASNDPTGSACLHVLLGPGNDGRVEVRKVLDLVQLVEERHLGFNPNELDNWIGGRSNNGLKAVKQNGVWVIDDTFCWI